MGVAEHAPGMEPGRTGRNALVGVAYLGLLSAAILALAPLRIVYHTWDGC